MRGGECSVSGYMTDDNVGRFITDKYFLGVGGLSLTKGITDYHMAESNHRRIVIANTQKVIALADHSKVGAVAMNKICGLEQVDTIVTDLDVDSVVVEKLTGMDIEVIQVKA